MYWGWKPGLKRLRVARQRAPFSDVIRSVPNSGPVRLLVLDSFGKEYLKSSVELTIRSACCGSATISIAR